MSGSQNGKVKDVDKAALQYELQFYTNLLAKHHEKHASITKFPASCSQNFSKRTVLSNQIPLQKSLNCIQSTSQNGPQVKCAVFNESHFLKRTVLQSKFKHISNKTVLATPSSYSKEQFPMLKNKDISRIIPREVNSSKFTIHNEKIQKQAHSIMPVKSGEKSILSSASTLKRDHLNSAKLMSEILTLTQKLKQTSKTLSSNTQISSNVKNSHANFIGKSLPKTSIKEDFVTTNKMGSSILDTKLNKANLKVNSSYSKLNSNHLKVSSFKPQFTKRADNTSILNVSKLANDLSSPLKLLTKTVSRADPILNGKELQMHTDCILKTPIIREIISKKSQSSHKYKTSTKSLTSKYKIINKSLVSSSQVLNSKQIQTRKMSSCSKYIVNNVVCTKKTDALSRKLSPQSFSAKKKRINTTKNINGSSKKVFCKTNNTNFASFPTLRKFNLKVPLKKQLVYSTPKKFTIPLQRASKMISKYKVDNKLSTSSERKMSNLLKIPTSKVCDIRKKGMDIDLLIELAAEKESINVNNRPIFKKMPMLVKRIYKSKNVLVNKNVYSVQAKAARMIKTKYCTLDKHRWRKHIQSKHHIKGFQNQLHAKHYPSLSHPSQIFRRKMPCYKKHYIQMTSSTRMKYSKFKRVHASPHNYVQSNRTPRRLFFRKQAVKSIFNTKINTPLSKTLANRAINRSINRVLTASMKKRKTLKVNTYCMFYNRFGRCNKGLKCQYVHDPSKIAICTRFLRGTCKVEHCPFSHEASPGKMAICSFFLLGSCTKDNCPYRHETLPPDAKLCKPFVQGYCPNGKECEQAHVLVCPLYVQGLCEKEKNCPFPHPPPKGKRNVSNATQRCETPEESEELLEKMCRYFEINNEETPKNLFVPKRQKLSEQPSFISLTMDST